MLKRRDFGAMVNVKGWVRTRRGSKQVNFIALNDGSTTVSYTHLMRSFAEWLEANFQWVTLNKLLSLGVAFFSAFTMFNWWLSYRLFTRSQVIKPKFRLL